ncbi:bactericidal permeability-increasing protein-like isoform X1 [Rhincodon typus]|uniref:bactericidal permeability-increasing protein-like isoform X1 n=1 Tax=Rhincodon typus TaxID=259920 RepID=UPI00202DC633|nr:bactericidal permeability-increasing protein-like isoform X1 [Rhincodon typus]
MNLSACITLVLIGTAIGKSGLNPGIQSKITQKALEYAKQIAITVAEEKIKGFQLPDLSGSIDLLGWINYRITGMHLKNFGLPSSNIGFIPNTGVKFSVDKVYIEIDGRWHVTFGLIKDGGTFNLNIKDLLAAFSVNISEDSSRPALSYNDCAASLNNFDLQLHGGGSWFYNMFLSQVKSKIREVAPQKLCSEFRNTIGKLETFIQTLNTSWQLDKYVEFDYSLVGELEITNNSIDLPIKGELYDVQDHVESPFTAQSFKLPNTTDQMLMLGLSEYFVNTGGFAYFSAGALHFNITDNMIPKDIPVRLNTSSLKIWMPKVAAQYPNMLMKIAMSASKQPVVRLVPGKLTADVFTAAEVFAILPNKSLAELFVLGATASVHGQIFISDLKVCGTVFLNRVDLTVEESKVGPIPTGAMEIALNLGLQKMVIPKINALLKKGFTIPTMDKVSLKNPVLKTEQGLIVITTDIKYRN